MAIDEDEPIKAGSRDTIQGTLEDLIDGVLTPVNLTGNTVQLKFQLNDRPVKTRTALNAPDQTTNTGVFTYELAADDLEEGGDLGIEAHATIESKLHISSREYVRVEGAYS